MCVRVYMEGEWRRWCVAREHGQFAKRKERSQQKGICRKERHVDGQPSAEELMGSTSAEKERGMSLATETTAGTARHGERALAP